MLSTIIQTRSKIQELIKTAKESDVYNEDLFDDLILDVNSYLDDIETEYNVWEKNTDANIDKLTDALKSIKDSIDEVKSYL